MNLRSAAVLAVCAILTGCAAEQAGPTMTDVDHVESTKAPVFTSKSINVDQRFSDAVKVNDASLVVPTSMLGKIEIGSIVAGDRSSKPGDHNPFGFLRRVIDIQKKGKETTLVTKKANLGEWIDEGRVDFSSNRSLLSGAKTSGSSITTKTLHLLDDNQEAAGTGEGTATMSGSLEDTISIENVNVSVSASFDGYVDIHKKWDTIPTGFKMKSQLTLTPSVGADIVWKIANEASIEGAIQGTEILIPLTTPIPMTVRYTPELKCNLSASGEAKITIGANISATSVLGFEVEGGLTDFPNPNNLSQAPSASGNLQLKEITGKATLSTECEVVGIVELLAFDAIGMKGRLGPWVNLTATMCANANAAGTNAGFTLQESHGFTESFDAEVQVPVIGTETTVALWSGKQTLNEAYLVGDEKTCDLPSADSCAGVSDGFHCSTLVANSGFVCENGQVLLGLQCDPAMKCTGGDATTILCQ